MIDSISNFYLENVCDVFGVNKLLICRYSTIRFKREKKMARIKIIQISIIIFVCSLNRKKKKKN